MKKSLLLLFSVLLFAAAQAQPNHYLFRKGAGTYTELTQATLASPIIFASGDTYDFPVIGETFSFFNKNYAVNGSNILLKFGTNGHIHIEDDTSFLIFDGLFRFMDSIDLTSSVSYKVEGTGNNKILKAQWKNLRIRGGATDNYVNFQIWVYQATGIFEAHYGPSSVSNQSGYTDATGPSIGIFHSDKAFTKMHEKLWINNSPSAYKIDSARNFVFRNMHGVPENGAVYRFIPKSVAASVPLPNEQNIFSVYPNPAKGKVYYKSSTAFGEELKVNVMDVTGKTILSTVVPIGTKAGHIDLKNVAPGQYFVLFEGASIKEQLKITLN